MSDSTPDAPITYEDIVYDSYVRNRQGSHPSKQLKKPEAFSFEPGDQKLIREADFFFLGTVTGAGWPYVQHRGGPAGFVHFIGPTTIAWAELEGNNQFVTTGNVDRDGRVALFFVNYQTRTRVKVFGNAHVVEGKDDPELMKTVRDLGDREIRSRGSRVMVVEVTAADRNCTKYIHPRWTKVEMDEHINLYRADIAELKEEKAQLQSENDELRARIAELEHR
ncbi:pyridoxamine 5'-phosphate oxidase family protein [Corynebacterium suicordis]